MSGLRVSIDHNGKTYAGEVMTIKSTRLGYEDHGILTAYLHCEYPGGGVGVGGYCLDEPKDREGRDYSRVGTAYGLDHLIRLLETVGVEKWEDLPGKRVVVLSEGRGGLGSLSVGIANIDTGAAFVLKDHATAWKTAEVSA